MSSEKESPSYLDNEIRSQVVDWLLNARYWLGVMLGMNGKNFPLYCHELKYSWYSHNGVRVSISPANDHSPYYTLFRDSSTEFRYRVFDFRLPKSEYSELNESFLKLVSEVEYLIGKFFPNIERETTWAICESLKSDNCAGKNGWINLCYVIREEKICEDCIHVNNQNNSSDFEGFVYLIGNHEQKIYKIGLSRQPRERFKAFGTKLPFKVEILHQIETTDMKKAEKILHTWMKDKNTHGEWFNLPQSDVDFICQLSTFEKGNFVNMSGNAVLEYPK